MSKFPHFEDCKCGSGKGPKPLAKDHDWYVNSSEHHNCFWVYFRHNTRSHTLNEVANLLDLSISAITSVERKALKKMKRRAAHFQLEKK